MISFLARAAKKLWRQSASVPAVPIPASVSVPVSNPLAGLPLEYLIGSTESVLAGNEAVITEVPYDAPPARKGISIGYCNLFDENNTGEYGPYLHTSDTAARYTEGQIDSRGAGWERHLAKQFERRRVFSYIELDNPDAYSLDAVCDAVLRAEKSSLKVIAKNALLVGEHGEIAASYVGLPNIYGVIVERGAGNPAQYELLRRTIQKPLMPVWFVFFGNSRHVAMDCAKDAAKFVHMGVTYSAKGEYGSCEHLLKPRRA